MMLLKPGTRPRSQTAVSVKQREIDLASKCKEELAGHPSLVAIELSSFKCGHNATIYSVKTFVVSGGRWPRSSFSLASLNAR